jgi:hypothetical protein
LDASSYLLSYCSVSHTFQSSQSKRVYFRF